MRSLFTIVTIIIITCSTASSLLTLTTESLSPLSSLLRSSTFFLSSSSWRIFCRISILNHQVVQVVEIRSPILVVLLLQLPLLGSFSLLLPLLSAPLGAEGIPPPVPLSHNLPVIRQLIISRLNKALNCLKIIQVMLFTCFTTKSCFFVFDFLK